MFTGLVEQTGKLIRRTAAGGASHGTGARLAIACTMERLELGESISVDGVCLTVDAIVGAAFECDASQETLSKTTLGELPVGNAVNLERATALGTRMGGHIVSGHVDGTGTLAGRKSVGSAVELAFAFPVALARYIAPKGSICVNGVSLTVNGVHDASHTFDVVVIPHTQEKTSLGNLTLGQTVNLEVDLIARYVARILQVDLGEVPGGDASLLAQLQRSGYT